MILLPMKCRLCGKTLSPPDEVPLLGQPPTAQNQRIIQKLLKHMQNRVEEEAKEAQANPHAPHPHLDAMAFASITCQNLNGALLIGNFEISADMERDRRQVLDRVHAITRSVRMSDEELRQAYIEPDGRAHIDALRDLRDRYEGLGRYAPRQANAAPEVVKQ